MRIFSTFHWPRVNLKNPALGVGLIIITLFGSTAAVLFLRAQSTLKEQLRDDLRQTAAIAALHFEAAELEQIQDIGDARSDVFRSVVGKLKRIQNELPDVRFVYLMRRTDNPVELAFIAEHDSLDELTQLDENGNGVIENTEEPSQPGDRYVITGIPELQGPAFAAPTVDGDITQDEWGYFISGYAPIFNASGATVAILGLDMDAGAFLRQAQSVISPLAVIALLFVGFVLAAIVANGMMRKQMDLLKELNGERYAAMQRTLVQIGGPVSSIRWWLELLREKRVSAAPDEDEAQMFVQLSQASDRLNNVMESVRRACDIEQGIVPQDPAELPLSAIITVATADVAGMLRQKNQRLNMNIDPELLIETDPDLLAGVLRELLENASMFSERETVITVRTETAGGNITIAIEDQGVGIAKQDQAAIFERAMQQSSHDRYKPTGSGLGLYLSRRIIEALGGTIHCHSRVGVGSTFTITLPSKQSSAS